jgi:hypothetical protein
LYCDVDDATLVKHLSPCAVCAQSAFTGSHGLFPLQISYIFSSTLKMEAIRSSETSVNTTYTRCQIPDDCFLHSHRRESLKSYIMKSKFHFVSLKDQNLCSAQEELDSIRAVRFPAPNCTNIHFTQNASKVSIMLSMGWANVGSRFEFRYDQEFSALQVV